MSEDLESKLREAMRPVAPRRELTDALISRLTEGRDGQEASSAAAPPVTRVTPARRLQRPVWWLPVGLAASLLLAVGIQSLHEHDQREKGLEARRQVFEALRVTNQKLDLVYRAVHDESKS
jgi:hypothetical protein